MKAWPTRELFVWLIFTHSWAASLSPFEPPLSHRTERGFFWNTPFQLHTPTPTLSSYTFANIFSNYFPWQQTAFLGRLIVSDFSVPFHFFPCILKKCIKGTWMQKIIFNSVAGLHVFFYMIKHTHIYTEVCLIRQSIIQSSIENTIEWECTSVHSTTSLVS